MLDRFQRKILIYKNYFGDFYKKQNKATRKKIDFTIDLLQVAKNIPETILRKLESTEGLYEIIIKSGIKKYSGSFASLMNLHF